MAAAQTAEQKAAAEAKAAEEKAAQEAAEVAAEAEAKRLDEAEAAANTLQVLGPVAVLPLKSGGERYVYRGTPISDEFTKEGVEHAVSVGLVGKPKKK